MQADGKIHPKPGCDTIKFVSRVTGQAERTLSSIRAYEVYALGCAEVLHTIEMTKPVRLEDELSSGEEAIGNWGQ